MTTRLRPSRSPSLLLAVLLLLLAACGGAPATLAPGPLPATPTAAEVVSPLPTPTPAQALSPLPTPSPAHTTTPSPAPAAGTQRYTSPEGWSFDYPAGWDRLESDLDGAFVQETLTGKTVQFRSAPSTLAELEAWLRAEIERKLAATEAGNTLAEPLQVTERDGLRLYRYGIASQLGSSAYLLCTAVFFDGARRVELRTSIPPLTEAELEAILASFRPTAP